MRTFNSQTYAELGEGIVPTPEFHESKLIYNLGKNSLMKEFIQVEHAALQTLYAAEVPSKSELLTYYTLLIYFRVKQVNRERLPFSPKHFEGLIPGFMNQMLDSIGELVSFEKGLRIRPSFTHALKVGDAPLDDVDANSLLTELSFKFKPFFEGTGCECSKFWPKDIEGNWELMELFVHNDRVYSESNKPDPMYAAMAGILCAELEKPVMIPRMPYAITNLLRLVIPKIPSIERRKGGKS